MNVFKKREVGDYEAIQMLMYFAVGLLVYILFVSIIWIIKCYRLRKKWIISWKILDTVPEKKIVWIITLIFLFVVVIVDFMYWKFRYSKIPWIDETTLNRKEHNIPLPAEEDAIIQLKALELEWDTDVWKNLDPMSSTNRLYYDEFKLWWEWNQDECEVIKSWDQSYCWTWAWNEKTINRYMNHYFYKKNMWWNDDTKEYLMVDGKKVTEKEYIAANEKEIKERIELLENILSLDYYLPNDKYFFYQKDNWSAIYVQYAQSFSRASIPLLQYYTQKKDRNMVLRIIKLNYKMADIFEDIGAMLSVLISKEIHATIDNVVNSSIWLYPQKLRNELVNLYSEIIRDKNEIIKKEAIWEHVIRNESKKPLLDELQEKPSPLQLIYHFPFISKNDTNRLIVFMDHCLSYLPEEQKEKCDIGWIDLDEIVYEKLIYSMYNVYWQYSYANVAPRLQLVNRGVDINIQHKHSLIDNLKAWKYVSRYNEPDRNYNKELYEQNLLVPPEE